MSIILCNLDGPYDGFVVIDLSEEAGSVSDRRIAKKTENDVVSSAQSKSNGEALEGLAGRQEMIDAIEKIYCDGAILMEELDASRKAE